MLESSYVRLSLCFVLPELVHLIKLQLYTKYINATSNNWFYILQYRIGVLLHIIIGYDTKSQYPLLYINVE